MNPTSMNQSSDNVWDFLGGHHSHQYTNSHNHHHHGHHHVNSHTSSSSSHDILIDTLNLTAVDDLGGMLNGNGNGSHHEFVVGDLINTALSDNIASTTTTTTTPSSVVQEDPMMNNNSHMNKPTDLNSMVCNSYYDHHSPKINKNNTILFFRVVCLHRHLHRRKPHQTHRHNLINCI